MSDTTTNPETHLRVIAWNVYEGHKPADVRKQLLQMIRRQRPDVIVLAEAIRQFGHLRDLGFQVVQLGPHAKIKGNLRSRRSETANVAILVRDGITIQNRGILRMLTPWKGPKHGIPHNPRVYRTVRIRKGGVTWNLAGIHVPFGKAARVETTRRMRRWFGGKTGPVIEVGDMNMRAGDLRRDVAKAAGARVAGARIDLTAYRGCRLVKHVELPQHGSDHHAQRYTFATERTGQS